MATAAVPEMDIVLFNVSGVQNTRTIEEDFKTMVGGYNFPLFVLTTGLSNQQKNYLCKRLQKHACKRVDQTAVYCRLSEPEQFKTSHIDLDTLKMVKAELRIEDKYFTIARLKACVLTPTDPGYDKILLVSWQGQKNDEHLGAEGMTYIDKETTFMKLVYFLKSLQKKEGCEVTIVGGDFNMSSNRIEEFLKLQETEGDIKPAVAARPDEPTRPLIIYWPQSKLQFEEKDSNTQRYAFELQPKPAQINNGSHPKLGIGLLNVYDGNNEKSRQNAIKYVLRRMNDNYQKPLFVLCQDGIKPPKHKILCEKLRCDYKACGMRKEDAGVYYRPSEKYVVTYVEDSMLEDEKKGMGIEITDLQVSRLMVCVVTPTDHSFGKVLLVSWHGPRGITKEKKKVLFKTVVEFLGRLMQRKTCRTVVLGGDFNMPFSKALECLKDLELEKRAKEVAPKERENKEQENKEESKEQRARDEENKDEEDKEQLTTEQSQEQQNKGDTKQQEDEELQYYAAQAHQDQDKSKLLDYIIYWPRNNTAPPLIDCPDYEKEMNFWPFDHRVFGFSFTGSGRSARRHSTQQTLDKWVLSGTPKRSKRPAETESSNMPGHSQQKQARETSPSGH